MRRSDRPAASTATVISIHVRPQVRSRVTTGYADDSATNAALLARAARSTGLPDLLDDLGAGIRHHAMTPVAFAVARV